MWVEILHTFCEGWKPERGRGWREVGGGGDEEKEEEEVMRRLLDPLGIFFLLNFVPELLNLRVCGHAPLTLDPWSSSK